MIPNKRPASEYRVRTLDRNDLNEKGKIYIGKGGTTTVDGVAGVSDITAKNIIDAINENATGKDISAGSFTAASFKGNADSATNATYAQYANTDTSKGTIENRLESAESTTSDFYRSYQNGFSPSSPYSNSINIPLSYIPNANVNTLFFVMIAIYNRSNSKWLSCCMTIGEGKSVTGYFITGVGTSAGITFLQSETISCTYSNNVYTLTGPSDEVSGGFKYDLIRAAVLKIA